MASVPPSPSGPDASISHAWILLHLFFTDVAAPAVAPLVADAAAAAPAEAPAALGDMLMEHLDHVPSLSYFSASPRADSSLLLSPLSTLNGQEGLSC
jgi:hypothetical protein